MALTGIELENPIQNLRGCVDAPVMAHGLENLIIEFNRSWNQQGGMVQLIGHFAAFWWFFYSRGER